MPDATSSYLNATPRSETQARRDIARARRGRLRLVSTSDPEEQAFRTVERVMAGESDHG